jgi:ferritin-like metal-binding protein YciE
MKNVANKSASEETQPNESTHANGLQSSQLMQLFESELKDIYWAEKVLTKAIPKMIKKASASELVDILTDHLDETEDHIKRLEQVFESINKKATAKKCEAMDGLVKEAGEIMEFCEEGAMRDAGIISAAQKAEHYEIATYGTLRQFAQTLELKEAVKLLQQTLDEEKAANKKLSEVAMTIVNIKAAEVEEV